jgi:CheY-like chemotaxis protein
VGSDDPWGEGVIEGPAVTAGIALAVALAVADGAPGAADEGAAVGVGATAEGPVAGARSVDVGATVVGPPLEVAPPEHAPTTSPRIPTATRSPVRRLIGVSLARERDPGVTASRSEYVTRMRRDAARRERIGALMDADVAGRGERVLVVEDEPSVRAITSRSLSRAGYDVIVAASPAEALSNEGPPEIDLLLTDVVMPGMNGRELAETLLDRRPGLRVLFMSGYTEDSVLRSGIENASQAFLQKPFSMRDLLSRVRQVLDAPARVPRG